MMGTPLLWRLLLITALTFTCLTGRCATEYSNVLIVLLSDVGTSDIQSKNVDMLTPNIDKIESDGLYLDHSYTTPRCGPSKAALLSGRYPHTWGASVPEVFRAGSTFYPKNKIQYIGDEMKKLGFATHALGKWQQGHCHPSLRPLGRGFDTFYGTLAGHHVSNSNHSQKKEGTYDWWDNESVDFSAEGKHSTKLLSKRMVRIINELPPGKPFFAYLAYEAEHDKQEVPHKCWKACKRISDNKRRMQCAAMNMIDAGIGEIVEALEAKGIYNSTAIVIMSDNGGDGNGSSNYPLRGGKGSLYEGGSNVYTIFKAPGLKVTNATWRGMISGVDWMPTLVSMAGGKKKHWMHGRDLWEDIKEFKDSNRNEVFYYFDPRNDTKHYRRAYRSRSWKIIQGNPGRHSLWDAPYSDSLERIKGQKKDYGPDDFQLYNLDQDPFETTDLAKSNPKTLHRIKKKMRDFLKRYKLQRYERSGTGKYRNPKTGHLNGCFCHPPWADDTPDCPSPSSS